MGVNLDAKISIDWLRFSFDCEAWPEISALFDNVELWQEGTYYRRSWHTFPQEGIIIATDKLPQNGVIPSGRFTLNMSGNGIAHFFQTKPHLTIVGFCKYALSLPECKVNRLDIAFDDYDGLLNIRTMNRMLKEGDSVVTRWKKASLLDGYEIGQGSESGETLYLGNRSSDSFMRVYDKRAQELARNAKNEALPEHWIRCELETTGKVADAVLRDMVTLDFAPEATIGLLRDKVDFHQSGTDRARRRPLAKWWLAFTEGLAKRPITIPRPVQSIERKYNWLQKAVSPTLALLMEHNNGSLEWLFDEIREGKLRLTSEHLALLKSSVTHGS